MYKTINEIKHYERPIHIKGLCVSSCTFALSYPDTCIDDNATLMFHAPRSPSGEVDIHWFKIMSNSYPDDLKEWFNHSVIDGEDHWISGYDFKKRFKIGVCSK